MARNVLVDLLAEPPRLWQQLLAACPLLGESLAVNKISTDLTTPDNRSNPPNARSGVAVGYSGGLDSTVLLHLLHTLKQCDLLNVPVRALHINHGLQEQAEQWELHCEQQCKHWQIPFVTLRVDVDQSSGLSLEEAARQARYAGFTQLLQHGELLVLAHHADDQAETFLINLLRGSGMVGLAGIPTIRDLANTTLLRPLLTVPHTALAAYAAHHQLEWVEDPSNGDMRFDRNYLRKQVLPLLTQRWPAAIESFARTSLLASEAANLLAEQAATDLQDAQLIFANRFPLAQLARLSGARQRNLLRYWLQQQAQVLMGHRCTYQEWQRSWEELVVNEKADYRQLALAGGRLQLHRYRHSLYLLKPLSEEARPQQWQLTSPLKLHEPCGVLHWTPATPELAAVSTLNVVFGAGGVRVPKPDGHHQKLQHYWQTRGTPPWLRPLVPLVFYDDELVAIGDELVPHTKLIRLGANAQTLHWERSHLLCGW